MAANKQIITSWHFWAGLACGVAATLLVLSLVEGLHIGGSQPQVGPQVNITVLDVPLSRVADLGGG